MPYSLKAIAYSLQCLHAVIFQYMRLNSTAYGFHSVFISVLQQVTVIRFAAKLSAPAALQDV